MQLDSAIKVSAPPTPSRLEQIKVNGEPLIFPEKYSRMLRRAQRIHAFTILIVPLLGTIAAIALILFWGVSRLDLGLFLVLYLLTMIGGSVGFHRLLSHRAFQTGRFVRGALIILGSMTAQGSPLYWASNHRRHHQFSDQEGDPHSPYLKDGKPVGLLYGLWHSHSGWSFNHAITNPYAYCKDLLADGLLMKLDRLYFFWIFLGLLLPTLIGGIVSGTWRGALTGFLWGGLTRVCLSYHSTCSINSIAHTFGSRPFNTREHSRNNFWLAIPTVGEAWHNNHHAFVTSPFFGLKWWQIDIGGLFVATLKKTGLAWNARRPTERMIEAAKRR